MSYYIKPNLAARGLKQYPYRQAYCVYIKGAKTQKIGLKSTYLKILFR